MTSRTCFTFASIPCNCLPPSHCCADCGPAAAAASVSTPTVDRTGRAPSQPGTRQDLDLTLLAQHPLLLLLLLGCCCCCAAAPRCGLHAGVFTPLSLSTACLPCCLPWLPCSAAGVASCWADHALLQAVHVVLQPPSANLLLVQWSRQQELLQVGGWVGGCCFHFYPHTFAAAVWRAWLNCLRLLPALVDAV